METKDILSVLTETEGVSGNEENVLLRVRDILNDMDIGNTDINFVNNTLTAKLGDFDDNKPTLMLEAHIDEIGMIVTYITDEGFLEISGVGGIDMRVLSASQVTVYGTAENGEIKAVKGVITSVPPHLLKDDSALPKIDDIYVDIGMSKEQAEKCVSLGDIVLIENKLADLQNGRVSAKALDDRSGVCAVIKALEMLKDKKLNCNIAGVFCSKEEIGSAGAKTQAYNLKPDMAVVVDVSFAKTHYESNSECGNLGEGPMIGIAPSLDKEMSKEMINTAKEKGIPYQVEVMSGRTGTDADSIGISRGGVKNVTVSIPEKHMHTPVEIVDIKDIENTAKLMTAFAESV